MQRPRRTTEFCDEPSTSKRLSRQTQRSIAPSPQTGLKYAVTRQTRAAARSLERTTLPAHRYNTPLRTTPIAANRSSVTQRSLFTAERIGALYNDKKWIQEQVQRINFYLENSITPGSVPGVGPEFFTRGPGMRQMTIKQFVGIINFFLHFIWNDRFKVGSNHVEDITNILQKLNYPHQVNKSWLKTPIAQHSFGHVIMLFDFLMDFAPPLAPAPGDEQQPIDNMNEFFLDDDVGPLVPLALQNISCNNSMSTSQQQQQWQMAPLDVQFQSQMIHDCEYAFQFWNNQQPDDELKQQTCNALIRKLCELPDSAALEAELKSLELTLNKLREKLPAEPKKEEKSYNELCVQRRQLQTECEKLEEDLRTLDQETVVLTQQSKSNDNEFKELCTEVNTMKKTVHQQPITMQQRNQLVEQCAQQRQQLEEERRALKYIVDRDYDQQVELSRSMKKLTDLIEQYNKHMRQVHFSEIGDVIRKNGNSDDASVMQLPLLLQLEQVESHFAPLLELRKHLFSKLCERREQISQIMRNMNELDSVIKRQLEPASNELEIKLHAIEMRFQKSDTRAHQQQKAFSEQMEKLEVEAQKLLTQIQQSEESNNQKQKEHEAKQLANEQLMCDAERLHAEYADKRSQDLDKEEENLTKLVDELKKLKEISAHHADAITFLTAKLHEA